MKLLLLSLLLGYLILVFTPTNSEAKLVKIPLERKVSKASALTNRRPLYEESLIKGSKKSVKSPLINIDNVYYLGSLSVGCPAQKVLLIFDTGSNALWFLSSKICTTDKNYCNAHRTFDNQKSKSYQKDGRPFSIKYVKGSVDGFIGRDDISVSGLKVEDQLFGEATTVSEDIKDFDYDGVFGLAFAQTNVTVASEPPFINMIKQKVVDKPVFAFYLSKTEKKKSELCFGGVDPAHYTGDFTFTPVIGRTKWFIKIDQMTFGTQKLVGAYPGIPDSGTTLIAGPPDILDPINKAIGKLEEDTGLYAVDCTKIKTFPTVTFVINNVKFPLSPDEYVQRLKKDDGSSRCVTGFIDVEGINFLILGDVFMRKYYIQFNVGERQIGIALAKP